MPEDRLKTPIASFLSPTEQLEEVAPTRHRPLRRQVVDIKPKAQAQEVPQTGDKESEGEHTVPAPIKETTNMQTASQQTDSFKFNPGAPSFTGPPSEDQVRQYADEQARAWQKQYAEAQSRQEFINSIKQKLEADGIAYSIIDASEVPLAVKNKHFEAIGVRPREPRGVRMTTTAVHVAVFASAIFVTAVMVVGLIQYFLMSDGTIKAELPTGDAPPVV
jgi:hypothetical protein